VTALPRTPSPIRPNPGTLDQVVDLLRGRRVAVLTGAGLSTDSGIPDYRGPDSPPRTPMTYQQFVGDEAFRRHYWARNHVGWRYVHRTEPNAGHRALASLEAHGVVVGLITQNVDLLHEQAGSRRVIDLHGRYDRVICLRCGVVVSRQELADRLEALNPGFVESVGAVGDVEIAPDADAVIEQTAHRVAEAYALVDDAEALLVAGSSLTVQSGLRFVRHAAAAGMPIVIVNRGATRGDPLATLTLDAGTTETLTALADRL
jgi:NAD-dependent SIR2 family protein deacetylase